MDDGQIGIFFLKLTSYVCSETINYLQLSVKKKKKKTKWNLASFSFILYSTSFYLIRWLISTHTKVHSIFILGFFYYFFF